MSTIQITFNLTKKTCKIDKRLESGDTSLIVQVNVEDANTAEVNHLSLGYAFSDNNGMISSRKFPEVGRIDAISTNNIIVETIIVEPNKTYKLYAWYENAGIRTEKDIDIKTPIPLQPYQSWTWNGTAWIPPVPMPTNGPKDASYKWSEKQQKWFHLVPPLHQFDDI